MMRQACAGVAMLLLAGCATVQEKSLATTGAGSGPKPGDMLGYSGSAADAIMAGQAVKAGFGVIGALAMAQDGKNIVSQNQITDPAGPMSRELAAEFAQARSARLAEAPIPPGDQAAAKEAQKTLAYVLVIETLNWGFMYFPADWGKYKVDYWARMRLVDSATKDNAAVKLCKWNSMSAGSGKLTRDELLQNNAEGLKAQFAKAAASCRDEFRQALGLAVRLAEAP